MAEPVRILHAEDLASDAELAAREFRRVLGEVEIRRVETEEEFVTSLAGFRPDLVVSDFRMPRFDGLTALKLTLARAPEIPVVILTGAMNEDTAVECMKAGATDYVIKEHLKRLGQAVVRALELRRQRAERRRAEEERAKLEAQLHQALKLESVGRLAGGVAHDFNNMLTVILAAAETMALRLPDGDPLRQDVDEILKAASRSRDITRQLLAFSRKQVISPRSVELNVLVQDSLKVLSRLIGEDVSVSFRPPAELWTVWVDPSQIDQILMNLVVNARDALPGGGSIVVETANVRIDESYVDRELARPGDYVLLSVSDDGVGMDATVRAHLFEPFFTTKEPGKGTGLGLSTVYGIARQNGGFVTVYSEPERGTTFKVYLPRATEEAHGPESSEAAAETGAGTVLLVEDSDAVRRSIAGMLSLLGYDVILARDALEALALCERGTPFDVLLTDVVMPGMNGAELRDRVCALRPGVPVLFTSGYPENVIAHQGVLEAGVHFIQKPFGIREIARKLREIL